MIKNRMYLICLFVLSIGVMAIPQSAFAFLGAEAGVGAWQQSPSGTFGYKGTDLDLKDDLKYDTKSNPFVRIKVDLPLILPNIYVMYTPMSFDGTGSKTTPFTYGNTTFNANAAIESKLKLDHIDLAFYYPIPLLNTATAGILNVDLGLNVRKIDFEGTITGTNSATGLTFTESKSLPLYIPMIYVGIQVKPMSLFAIELEGRMISAGASHYNDYIARLKIKPIGPLFIAGGYRTEDIKIDASDVKAAIKFSGPFAEVGLAF